jgi:hypothetical protein
MTTLPMATFPTSRAAGFSVRPENSLAHVVEIKEKFAFRVLDEAGGHLASGRVVHLVGRRLIARVSEYLKSDTCVRIDCDDTFLLGEILGCWREGPATFAAVELLQALTGLEELARLQEKYWDSPQPLKPEVRQRVSTLSVLSHTDTGRRTRSVSH